MNAKIIDYRLVHYGGADYSTMVADEIEKRIRGYISDGWEPLGGIASAGGFCGDQEYAWLYQAMVKRESSPPPIPN